MAIITREQYTALSGITDESLDTMIDLLIPTIEEDYLAVRGTPFEVDDALEVVYPSGALLTAKLMLDWLLSDESGKALGSGLKSESIGKYSFSMAEIDEKIGYPKSLIGRIASFARGR